MDERCFIIELTMGILTVYFPTRPKWEAGAPDWAKHQWERVKEDLVVWCKAEHIPLRIQDDAWVDFPWDNKSSA
ncbi:hypothetical protein Cflav_PD5175 [Pedosphaera parvula Ellin514]|uniref:Uncharacterized protein n=2 Tax=Pedosphaera TaxID=1032526 RepID=B9XC72_PEDPL|nr:hypothetical protein Cflav_PD5175 [Pedosphaera parvula Ellin514]